MAWSPPLSLTGTFGEDLEDDAMLTVPPSPYWTPLTVPPDRILRQQTVTVEESYINIPLTPPNEEEWIGCLLSTDDTKPDTISGKVIQCLPSIHVVGKDSSTGTVLVAVASSRESCLRGTGIPLRPLPGRVMALGEGEEAQITLASAAAESAAANCPKGLLRFYRELIDIEHEHLLVPMEWAELAQDIQAAGDQVILPFAKICRHLCLRHFERSVNVSTESVQALLCRPPNEWAKELLRATKSLNSATLQPEDAAWERHIYALVRDAFQSAGGPTNWPLAEFDQERSADENLAAFCGAFGVYSLPSLDSADAKSARDLVVRALGEDMYREEVIVDQLLQRLGLKDGAPMLPAGLLASLSRKAVADCLPSRIPSNLETDELRSPENMLPLFLCAHARVRGVCDPLLRKWMVSNEGENGYVQITATLGRTKRVGQMALCLAAALYYMQVLKGAHKDYKPVHSSHLHDFVRHLDGRQPRSRAMWESMVSSFRRIAAGYETPPAPDSALFWLEPVVPASLPLDVTDCVADGYWELRTRSGLSHDAACDAMAGNLCSLSAALGDLRSGLQERKRS